jgi:protein required for attachment to host cells
MNNSKIRNGDWIVVCDGRKALILENRGDSVFPNLHTLEVREHADLPSRELKTDRPGRVHESVGAARSAVDQSNPHAAAEDRFLMELAHHLDTARARSKARRILLVAAPRALGLFRKAMSPALSKQILKEIDQDWVNMPIAEMEKRLLLA